MKFSLLISVYKGENAAYLDEALQSIEKQTYPPEEIVLVKDGPLDRELDEVIASHIMENPALYCPVTLPKNMGLGGALHEGMKYCSHEWIARMDSDDIALPERFQKQFDFLKEHTEIDVLGGWICEFEVTEDNCEKERRVPEEHEGILRFAKYRNPMNHVTVVFRKSIVEAAGGYQPLRGFEDYLLWMRLLMDGRRFANLPEVLVAVRTGRDMLKRRQGWAYVKEEVAFEREAYRIGFWSRVDLFRNLFLRILPRLLPLVIVEKLYNHLRKK